MKKFVNYFIALITIFYSIEINASMLPHGGFSDVVEKVMPSVVDIVAKFKVQNNISRQGFPNDPGLNEDLMELLERFGFMIPGIDGDLEGGGGRQMASQGSGFIIDNEGYIITNYHVIAASNNSMSPTSPSENNIIADDIKVTLNDYSEHSAEVVGFDVVTDLALLKIKANKNLPVAPFGDSDKAMVGDWVVAIGNPFGLLTGSVTAGIISARGRDIKYGNFDDFIQTDAAVNFGNSGGPLFNTNGEVIGVNTAIYSPSGGNVGIAFATPSSIVKKVADQIKQYGKVKRGWLGVYIQPVDEKIAQALNYKDKIGVVVSQLLKEGPAGKAGIEPNDIIISFNGKKLEKNSARTLPKLIAEAEIGKTYEMEVFRNGKVKIYKVNISENPGSASNLSKPKFSKVSEDMEGYFGIKLAELDTRIKSRLKSEVEFGVVIAKIKPRSLAFVNGLRQSDIIVQIDKQDIKTIEDFYNITKKAIYDDKKKSLIMLVDRNGQKHLVAVDVK
ncbi:MAG: Do family serine endopeptidase [Sphingobacteriia bacterium]|nr:Do family serine endopeptidase [Sphingobacteriia bacterium]